MAGPPIRDRQSSRVSLSRVPHRFNALRSPPNVSQSTITRRARTRTTRNHEPSSRPLESKRIVSQLRKIVMRCHVVSAGLQLQFPLQVQMRLRSEVCGCTTLRTRESGIITGFEVIIRAMIGGVLFYTVFVRRRACITTLVELWTPNIYSFAINEIVAKL